MEMRRADHFDIGLELEAVLTSVIADGDANEQILIIAEDQGDMTSENISHRSSSPHLPSAARETIIETILTQIIDKMDNDEQISASDCGKVARCIIMAWVRLVTLVSWADRGTGHLDDDGIYHPPSLNEIPYMSAWE